MFKSFVQTKVIPLTTGSVVMEVYNGLSSNKKILDALERVVKPDKFEFQKELEITNMLVGCEDIFGEVVSEYLSSSIKAKLTEELQSFCNSYFLLAAFTSMRIRYDKR